MPAKTSPLMEQFARIKRAHTDALLFFRVGDFYETFHDDAIEASRLLGITLTSRNKNDPEPIPLASVLCCRNLRAMASVVRIAPNPSLRASASPSISRSISTPYTRCMQPMYVCPNSSYAYMKGHARSTHADG